MGSEQIFRWRYLLEKYAGNNISRQELSELLELARELENESDLSDSLKKYWEKAKEAAPQSRMDLIERFDALLDRDTMSTALAPVYPARKRVYGYRAAAVAAGILMLCAAAYFLTRSGAREVQIAKSDAPQKQYPSNLKPGTDGAVLTLADGRQIDLDGTGNGVVKVQDKSVAINKNGKISYQHTQHPDAASLYNTVRTPKGKQYQVELSDGSRVWLNAASSIRFPVAFSSADRTVDITGEAYFEVAKLHTQTGNKNVKVPFIVRFHTPAGADAAVRVLGTHFNINTYSDEASANTSLLEGSVQISLKDGGSAMLVPGQQAQIGGSGKMNVADHVDMDAVTAWKNGYFSFNKTDLASLMRQIARWYNVDVVYAGAVPDRIFGGEISRSSNASQVLKILEESKVHFKVEGSKIIVLP